MYYKIVLPKGFFFLVFLSCSWVIFIFHDETSFMFLSTRFFRNLKLIHYFSIFPDCCNNLYYPHLIILVVLLRLKLCPWIYAAGGVTWHSKTKRQLQLVLYNFVFKIRLLNFHPHSEKRLKFNMIALFLTWASY